MYRDWFSEGCYFDWNNLKIIIPLINDSEMEKKYNLHKRKLLPWNNVIYVDYIGIYDIIEEKFEGIYLSISKGSNFYKIHELFPDIEMEIIEFLKHNGEFVPLTEEEKAELGKTFEQAALWSYDPENSVNSDGGIKAKTMAELIGKAFFWKDGTIL